MSTLDSWIDRDELEEVIAALVPATGPAPVQDDQASGNPDEAPDDEEFSSFVDGPPARDESMVVEETGPDEVFDTGLLEMPFPDDSPEAEVLPESSPVLENDEETSEVEAGDDIIVDPVVESNDDDEEEDEAIESSLDFNEPQAYEATSFPAPEEPNPDSPVSPLRRTAAVQAAQTLERARDRAREGGLLRGLVPTSGIIAPSPVDSPLPEPEPTPEIVPDSPETDPEGSEATEISDEVAEETVAAETQEPPVEDPPDFDPESAMTQPLDLSGPPAPELEVEPPPISPEVETPPEVEESPEPQNTEKQSLRSRLRKFVERAAEVVGTNAIAITDYQSYPLLSDDTTAPPAHSALRLANRFGSMAEKLHASSDGVTQIALEQGNWLCVVAADSATGGVCVSFRLPTPMASDIARQLSGDLRETLGKAPVV